jgi:dipeptidyl aminopeptidase/acylaminoacyl peptidase
MQPDPRRSDAHTKHAVRLAALALVVISACERDATNPEPSDGTLRVLMRTNGFTLDGDGYSYRVGSVTVSLAVQDSQDVADLPAGEVPVELSGIASNCRAFTQGPESVTIVEHEVVTASLLVSCDSALQNVVLFEHWADGSRPALWLIRPDGTGKEPFLADAWRPAATPNGTEVIYSDWAVGRLWRIRADRTNQRPVVGDAFGGGQYDPDVSPDGRAVVFSQWAGDLRQIYRVDLSGGEPQQLTFGAQDDQPRWSPNGRFITFTRFGADNITRAYLVPAEGGDTVRLTGDGSCCARWSPDGSRLLYSIGNELRTITPDGNDDTPISLPFLEHTQVGEWSSDGVEVLVETYVEDHMEIRRVPLDGDNHITLADNPLYNRLGRWLR